jgi:anti-sigma factor RsiW
VTCDDLQTLVHGYVDGELDLIRHLDVERHLANCLSCARVSEKLQVLQAALKGERFRFQTPPGLARRIESSLRELDQPKPVRRWPRGWIALAAAAVLALTIGGLLRFQFGSVDDRLVEEVVAVHVRSLMAAHITDVRSSDQHTVKPWFRGQLDFAPTVRDLSAQGFDLDGGRLDYLDRRPVVALVYHRRKHTINLLIWPSSEGSDEAPQSLSRQGFHMIRWRAAGMNYWAISDLNTQELSEFVGLWQS